jgi:hypothetical protein
MRCHLDPNQGPNWNNEISYVEYYEFENIIDTYLIEIYLISKLNPKYNREFIDTVDSKTIYTFTLPTKKSICDVSIFSKKRSIDATDRINVRKLLLLIEEMLILHTEKIDMYTIFKTYYADDHQTKMAMLNFRRKLFNIAKKYDYIIYWHPEEKLLIPITKSPELTSQYIYSGEVLDQSPLYTKTLSDFEQLFSNKPPGFIISKKELKKLLNISGRTLRYYYHKQETQALFSKLNLEIHINYILKVR